MIISNHKIIETGESIIRGQRMRNVRVIFDQVTVSLELFVSSKTERLGGRLKESSVFVNGSSER